MEYRWRSVDMRTYCAARCVLRELGRNVSLTISALAIDPAPEVARGDARWRFALPIHQPSNASDCVEARAEPRCDRRNNTSASGTFVWTGRALQAECDDLEVIGLALLYPAPDGAFVLLAIMDIRAHP